MTKHRAILHDSLRFEVALYTCNGSIPRLSMVLKRKCYKWRVQLGNGAGWLMAVGWQSLAVTGGREAIGRNLAKE